MISVIVTSHNRRETLGPCLAALLSQQDAPEHELIVIDQGSTDGSQDLVRETAKAHRHVRLEICTEVPLNAKRNQGLALATHGIVAFIDDDALPNPYWLRGLAAEFHGPARLIVTGRVLPLNAGFRRGLRTDELPRVWGRSVLDRLVCWRPGCGTNMALRREVTQRVGLFDPEVGLGSRLGGAGDETEFFFRAMLHGVPIHYTPDAIVRHQQSPDMADSLRRIQAYHYGIAAFLRRKYPRRWETPAIVLLRLGQSLAAAGLYTLCFRREKAALSRAAAAATWRAIRTVR